MSICVCVCVQSSATNRVAAEFAEKVAAMFAPQSAQGVSSTDDIGNVVLDHTETQLSGSESIESVGGLAVPQHPPGAPQHLQMMTAHDKHATTHSHAVAAGDSRQSEHREITDERSPVTVTAVSSVSAQSTATATDTDDAAQTLQMSTHAPVLPPVTALPTMPAVTAPLPAAEATLPVEGPAVTASLPAVAATLPAAETTLPVEGPDVAVTTNEPEQDDTAADSAVSVTVSAHYQYSNAGTYALCLLLLLPVWVPGLRIDPLRLLAGCRKRRLNQAPLSLRSLI